MGQRVNPSWFAEVDSWFPEVDEEAQMVSAVGLETSLWSSDTWAGKRLKIQKKYRKITFAEDLVSYLKRIYNQDYSSSARLFKDHFCYYI